MRKTTIFIAVFAVLCLIPMLSAFASTGTVTASALNVRADNSTESKVVTVLHKGDRVTIKSTSGSWYKISYNGRTGYASKKYINISSSSSSSSSSSGKSSGTCSIGDKGDAVKKVQKRLIALGYLSGGSDDGSFGNQTKNAVKEFQSRNGLSTSGSVNSATLKKLNSSDAKKASSSSSKQKSDGTCSYGDKGSNVKNIQKRLITLGYLASGSADGDYGNKTRTAVQNFQQRNGLSVTGNVNSKTLSTLNSSNAKKAKTEKTGKAEELKWFSGGSNKIPKRATFKIKDIRTGKVFTVRRWSGYNHIDAEPLTKSDTNTLKSIYGGWSWRRRPILVKYNGHVYAASMNGMPHGTSTISNNGFDGHFCIHFSGSKTHGTKRVDGEHQNCVRTALNYSW